MIKRLTRTQMFCIKGKAKTSRLGFKEQRLETADAKPWGRSPSRWTPCWTARAFSAMSPACWQKQGAEFSVTTGSRCRDATLQL